MVPAFAASLGGEKQRGQESQPIVYDGMIYVTGSYSRVFAFDARTGEKQWEYDARLPDGIMPCCDVVNRGAAIYGDKIIFGTLDAHVVALNRKTGKVIWNKTVADYQAGYSQTAAPLIVKGMVITGVSGGEFGAVGVVEARRQHRRAGVDAAGDRRPHGHPARPAQRHDRQAQRHLAGRLVEDRRRRHLAGRHL
jgi:alcohol dehydrogenase (cytochrome c)